MKQTQSRIIVALDYQDSNQADLFVKTVTPEHCALKVGKELFTSAGPQFVERLVSQGFDVFLDLKFHDIPHTVNKAITAACNLGVWMVNVHALGGREMLLAAKEAVDSCSAQRPLLIAVSILTSMNQAALSELGIDKPVAQLVSDLTQLSLDCGLDGMVCSAREVAELRQKFGAKPIFVTPGIRPTGSENNDQHRIMTPEQAIQTGSSFLVIGRPITQHEHPTRALQQINQSLANL